MPPPPPPPPPPVGAEDSIRIAEPKGGETWHDGDYQRITWTSSSTDDSVAVTALLRGGSGEAITVVEIATVPVGNAAVTWLVPRLADTLFEARVAVRLLNAGAADTSGTVEIRHRNIVAGIDDDARDAIALRIVPNPASEIVEIRAAGAAEGRVRLYAADGTVARIVELRAGAAQLALDGIAAGSYIVEVESPSGRTYSRLIVVH
jgi:hypothetical protein